MPKQPKIVTVDEIIEHFGGPTKLGALIGRTPQYVNMWRQYIPHKQAFNVARLSRGKWTLEQMTVKPDPRVMSAA
jgi:hypothetical protein